jgi:SpoVK/Ycf46/Vps4 family AAA+-type ATPase
LTNFSRVIHVGIPSKADRIEILKSKFPPEKLAADVDFAVLASKTQKFSAHDLEFLCIDAYHLSLENYTRSNIEAISSVGFSLTNNMVK